MNFSTGPKVAERPQWQRFLERRSSWPLDEERLRQGQAQPQEGMRIRVPAPSCKMLSFGVEVGCKTMICKSDIFF